MVAFCSLAHDRPNRRRLRLECIGILRLHATLPSPTRTLTFGRLCIAVVVIAFASAELWHPTLLRPKKSSATNLVVATVEAAPYGTQTELASELLDDLPRVDALPLGNIDAVILPGRNIAPGGKREISIPRHEEVRIVGWLADSQSRTPGAAVFPILDGRRLGDADVTYGSIRPDVGRYYQTPALNPTGFALSLPAWTLARGRHRVEFGLITSDRRGFFLAPEALVLNASQ